MDRDQEEARRTPYSQHATMAGSVSHNDGQDRQTYGYCCEIVVPQVIDGGYRSAANVNTTSHVSHTLAARREIEARSCCELSTEAEGREPAVDGSGSHPTTKCEEQKYEGGGTYRHLHINP